MAYQSKKHRKFVATSVTAALVASAVAPVAGFAAEVNFKDTIPAYAKKAVDYLVGKDVLKGLEDGTFGAGKELTRGEAATILARALELTIDETAKASFPDVPATHYASSAIAAIQKHNKDIIKGYDNGKFGPSDKITREQLAVMVAEAYKLKLDESAILSFTDNNTAWAKDAVNTLASLGIVGGKTKTAFDPKANVTRGEAAVFVHRTLVPAERLEVETSVLKVNAVTAVNSKEIVIEFNQAMDEVTASNAAYYALEVNNSAAAFTVDFDEDAPKKVTLIASSAIANDSVLKVTVKKSVLAANLKALDADYTSVFVSSDKVAPSIVKVAKSGIDVVVTFSEDIASTIGLVKFNGATYAAADYVVSGKTLKITGAAANLANGTYDLVLNGVADLVPTLPNTTGLLTSSLTISADTTVPTVSSVKQIGDNQVRVTFNKPVTSVGTTPVAVTKNGYQLTLSATTWNLDRTQYTYTLADNGAVKVYDANTETSSVVVTVNGFKDGNGTIANNYSQALTITKDKTVPTVVTRFNTITDLGTAPAKNEVFDIYFSEEITLLGTMSSVVLTDKNGIRQLLTGLSVVQDANGDDTVLRVQSTNVQTTGAINPGEYTITLPAGLVKDGSLNANKNAAATVKITKSGTSATGTSANVSAAGNVITVTYGDDMSATATNASNYLLDGKALPAGTVVYFEGTSKVVKIELPTGSVSRSGGAVLTLSDNIVTQNGLKVVAGNKNLSIVGGLVDNIKPVLTAAKKTSTTQVELTFSEAVQLPVTVADAINDFVVTINGVTVTPSAIAAGTAGKLILTLDSYNTAQEVKVSVSTTATIDVTDGANFLTTGTVVVAQ